MLAINTQLSGLIMWNCGKFTWGSGTNDIRVWPCFSEMAPAPAAGTRRLPKKIWSHFVLPPSPITHHPLPPFPTAAHPPFQSLSLSLSSHFALKFINLSPRLLLLLLHLRLLAKAGTPNHNGSSSSRLSCNRCISGSATWPV